MERMFDRFENELGKGSIFYFTFTVLSHSISVQLSYRLLNSSRLGYCQIYRWVYLPSGLSLAGR